MSGKIFHAPFLTKHIGFELVAVVERSEKRAHLSLPDIKSYISVDEICADADRDGSRLMIVHMPADVAGIEAAHCHDGLYFVLMGQVSPAQGMDLSHIALEQLVARLQGSEVEEIIIATNFTAEGDATAYVLSELLKNLPYKISRLARGMPLGGELEYVDAGTLAQAVHERRLLKE